MLHSACRLHLVRYNLDVYAKATNLHLMNANPIDSVNGYTDIIYMHRISKKESILSKHRKRRCEGLASSSIPMSACLLSYSYIYFPRQE